MLWFLIAQLSVLSIGQAWHGNGPFIVQLDLTNLFLFYHSAKSRSLQRGRPQVRPQALNALHRSQRQDQRRRPNSVRGTGRKSTKPSLDRTFLSAIYNSFIHRLFLSLRSFKRPVSGTRVTAVAFKSTKQTATRTDRVTAESPSTSVSCPFARLSVCRFLRRMKGQAFGRSLDKS